MNRRRFAKQVQANFLLLLLPMLWGTARAQTSTTQTVRIRFEGRLSGKTFACGSQYEGVGSEALTVTPVDLRFFISEAALLRADGTSIPIVLDQDGVWQYKSLALVDLENAIGGCRNGNSAMHTEVTGTVPEGAYVGLRFTLGVPFEMDHIDSTSAASPLNMTAMQWNWQNGYKFLRAEIAAVPPEQTATLKPAALQNLPTTVPAPPGQRMRRAGSGFPVHIGSTGCASPTPDVTPLAECKHPNRAVITLPDFDVTKDVVVFDMGKLFAHSNLSLNSPNTSPGCMSFEGDPDCAPVMEALGIPYGDSQAKTQVVFYRGTK